MAWLADGPAPVQAGRIDRTNDCRMTTPRPPIADPAPGPDDPDGGAIWLPLLAHPASPPRGGVQLLARYDAGDDQSWPLQFRVQAPLNPIRGLGPRGNPAVAPCATDGLWQSTCFELFLADADGAGGYREYNYAPDGRWAAYDFAGYRQLAGAAPARPDAMHVAARGGTIDFRIRTGLSGLAGRRIGLSAVIEEADGTKSYWALAHPADGPPDFHHPACFALTLAAPGAP